MFLTPDSASWNPQCESFARNKESMLDFQGNIVEPCRRTRHLMEPDTDDYTLAEVSTVDWNDAIDDNVDESFEAERSNNLDEHDSSEASEFANALNLREEISGSIGSCIAGAESSDDIFETKPFFTTIDDLKRQFSKELRSTISAATADAAKGVKKVVLAKLWSITEDAASGAIEHSTQLNRQSADNSLARHFSTNDRMLRYKRINSTFYTDTMFATDKAKSTRGNKCCQVFVSDKGFVAVYPMETVSQFEDALQLFCKEVGVPVTMVADPHPTQTKKSVRRFCKQVGMTLRLLEMNT